ncbi:MAG: hypothetical protein HYR66_09960 [Sphingobacteriales bacterium]|nr:hypothetical protein [Sphingobacteriales bacterium]MBI3719047.1 hypothetical protein [Sphingobacteriales bacterium]
MKKRIIRLCYRKIVDSSCTNEKERIVFETTYGEFLLQSQFYNREKKFSSFEEIIKNNPAAEKLHFLVSAGAMMYLQQLNKIIPGVEDNLKNTFLPFSEYKFELLGSDTSNKTTHKVAINFYSDPLLWIDTIDEYLLVSTMKATPSKDGILTNLFTIQPNLSFYSFKEEAYD